MTADAVAISVQPANQQTSSELGPPTSGPVLDQPSQEPKTPVSAVVNGVRRSVDLVGRIEVKKLVALGRCHISPDHANHDIHEGDHLFPGQTTEALKLYGTLTFPA